jgi:hypothetical protein
MVSRSTAWEVPICVEEARRCWARLNQDSLDPVDVPAPEGVDCAPTTWDVVTSNLFDNA